MTGRNQEITPHVRNYRRPPLRSNNSMNVVVCQCMLDVEAKSLQHPNVEEVFYVNNGFTFNVDGGGVCGDDGHGGSSVFAGICHGDLRRRLVFL